MASPNFVYCSKLSLESVSVKTACRISLSNIINTNPFNHSDIMHPSLEVKISLKLLQKSRYRKTQKQLKMIRYLTRKWIFQYHPRNSLNLQDQMAQLSQPLFGNKRQHRSFSAWGLVPLVKLKKQCHHR